MSSTKPKRRTWKDRESRIVEDRRTDNTAENVKGILEGKDQPTPCSASEQRLFYDYCRKSGIIKNCRWEREGVGNKSVTMLVVLGLWRYTSIVTTYLSSCSLSELSRVPSYYPSFHQQDQTDDSPTNSIYKRVKSANLQSHTDLTWIREMCLPQTMQIEGWEYWGRRSGKSARKSKT